MNKIAVMALFFSLAASAADARYVDYPGSVTTMLMNDGENNAVHLSYTANRRWSVGAQAEYWREEEWTFTTVEAAYLARRWNFTDAQANLYLRAGAGAAVSDFGNFDDKVEAAGFAGIAFDAENRRFYVSYENRYVEAGDIFDGFEQKAHFGVAPYIAGYGALHTWLMIQVDHRPDSEDSVVWTPMVRFVKGDVIVEAGVSDTEEILFNVTVRF